MSVLAKLKHLSALSLKIKLILAAVLLGFISLPTTLFLHNSLEKDGEWEIIGISETSPSPQGEVAGESTQNSQNPTQNSSEIVSPSPKSANNSQANQNSNSSNTSNNTTNNSQNNTPSSNTTNSSSNNSQSTTGSSSSPNPSPSQSTNHPSPSPSSNNVVFDASFSSIERSADKKTVTWSISANENINSCKFDYDPGAMVWPNGGYPANISGSNCSFSFSDQNNKDIKGITVYLSSNDGEGKTLSHSF